MIYLFSNRVGPLRDGATFMQTKSRNLHPGDDAFYLIAQQGATHGHLWNLGPNSTFETVDCRLVAGETAIIVGHGAADNNTLHDEAGANVTDAALRLLAKIAADNPGGGYKVFLAACGGAVRQPGAQTSLLSSLVQGVPALAQQLLAVTISCWGYTASAGLVALQAGVPANRAGTHIYGSLTDANGIVQHCGYDTTITTRLRRLPDGRYVTIYFSPALYPIDRVVAWVDGGSQPGMQTAFPQLYATLRPTA